MGQVICARSLASLHFEIRVYKSIQSINGPFKILSDFRMDIGIFYRCFALSTFQVY